MSQERLQILNMLEEGKISTEEASKLLAAIGEKPEPQKEIQASKSKAHWLKVRVWENGSEKPKVNVSVPLAVAKIALKLGGKFSTMMPKEARESMEEKGINVDELKNIEQVTELIDGMSHEGPFTLVEVDEENEKVLITIE
ncbi:MAG: SHOCT-like domain-containing protein [Candidatus Zixiibacteriota bacterium]